MKDLKEKLDKFLDELVNAVVDEAVETVMERIAQATSTAAELRDAASEAMINEAAERLAEQIKADNATDAEDDEDGTRHIPVDPAPARTRRGKKAPTEADCKIVLGKVIKDFGNDACIDVIQSVAGTDVDKLSRVPEHQYEKLIKAANEYLQDNVPEGGA
jgi:putative transposon-encoded protein